MILLKVRDTKIRSTSFVYFLFMHMIIGIPVANYEATK